MSHSRVICVTGTGGFIGAHLLPALSGGGRIIRVLSRSAASIKNFEPFVLFLGRLSPIRGADLLLNAFKRIVQQFPASRLVFAGPDAELGENSRFDVLSVGLSTRIILSRFLAGLCISMFFVKHFPLGKRKL